MEIRLLNIKLNIDIKPSVHRKSQPVSTIPSLTTIGALVIIIGNGRNGKSLAVVFVVVVEVEVDLVIRNEPNRFGRVSAKVVVFLGSTVTTEVPWDSSVKTPLVDGLSVKDRIFVLTFSITPSMSILLVGDVCDISEEDWVEVISVETFFGFSVSASMSCSSSAG